MAVGSFDAWASFFHTLGHAEVLNRTGQAACHLRNVAGEAGIPSDINVDGVGGLIALLFGEDGLLLKERSQKFVRILERTKREYARGIDLVEDGNFAVEVGIAGERVVFEVSDLRLNAVRRPSNPSDGGHGIDVGAIGQLD